MQVLGLDIGGANIKGADSTGRTLSRPFAVWKHPELLGEQIRAICGESPGVDRLAVTMTAELADCFSTKAEGVRFILDQVQAAAGRLSCQVWTTAGHFVDPDVARRQPMLVAAANWHALATWVGRHPLTTTDSGVLIDIGSTTTDIIPLVNGAPAPVGLTDLARIQSGELCYSGVRRTPLCAVAYSVPFRQGTCHLAAELFATTLDAYLLLGDIAEDEFDTETANGKPATRSAAHDRIARLILGDRDEVSYEEAVQIARFLADVQRQRLAGALDRVVHRLPGPCATAIVSGSGSFLARRLLTGNRRFTATKVTSLDELLSPGIAEAACAFAIASLACEDFPRS